MKSGGLVLLPHCRPCHGSPSSSRRKSWGALHWMAVTPNLCRRFSLEVQWVMILEAKKTTLDSFHVVHIITPWPGVTNLTLHNVENALKSPGTDRMHYHNFYCKLRARAGIFRQARLALIISAHSAKRKLGSAARSFPRPIIRNAAAYRCTIESDARLCPST